MTSDCLMHIKEYTNRVMRLVTILLYIFKSDMDIPNGYILMRIPSAYGG